RRSQCGNNNAWCQDSELSWFDWSQSPEKEQMRDFTRRLIRLRREHQVFRRESFLLGREQQGSGLPDVWWFRPDGMKMTRKDWQDGEHVLGMFLNGEEIPDPDETGEEIVDDSFIVLFNPHHEDRKFTLPRRRFGKEWALELSTADPAREAGSEMFDARAEVPVVAHSVIMLKRAA
ncbi:MAG TPA: glycogen debranching enzyme GlgX, partial [Myxococcaceae bacterium]|nr:glycogen debranching enzyme GlgX [Myxococcaceae bacterium]